MQCQKEREQTDDPETCLHEGGQCPFQALAADAPHLVELYWFALGSIEETERESEATAALRDIAGTSGVVKERRFGLSIERFWHFWRLKAGRHGLDVERHADEAWEVCAVVRQACEEAQVVAKNAIWERRRARRAAEAALREAGAPLPPVIREG